MTEIFSFQDHEYHLTEEQAEALREKLSEVEPNEWNLKPSVVESKIQKMGIQRRKSKDRTSDHDCKHR